MKFVSISLALTLLITACSRPVPTSDDYFKSVTPRSEALRSSEDRLRQAEDRARMNGAANAASQTQSTVDLIEQAENELNAEDAVQMQMRQPQHLFHATHPLSQTHKILRQSNRLKPFNLNWNA